MSRLFGGFIKWKMSPDDVLWSKTSSSCDVEPLELAVEGEGSFYVSIVQRNRVGELKNNSAINLKKADKGTTERILPFVTTYHPAVKKLKQIVMENWRFIENKPMLKTIFF